MIGWVNLGCSLVSLDGRWVISLDIVDHTHVEPGFGIRIIEGHSLLKGRKGVVILAQEAKINSFIVPGFRILWIKLKSHIVGIKGIAEFFLVIKVIAFNKPVDRCLICTGTGRGHECQNQRHGNQRQGDLNGL